MNTSRTLLAALLCLAAGCAGRTPMMKPSAVDVLAEAQRMQPQTACAGDTCLHYAKGVGR